MGLLTKIIEAASKEKTAPDIDALAPAAATLLPNQFANQCKGNHKWSQGKHLWLDTYSQWHCMECEPPTLPNMVRQQIVLGQVNRMSMSTAISLVDLLGEPCIDEWPTPCPKCGSLRAWWDFFNCQHCMDCEPPAVAIRLLKFLKTLTKRNGMYENLE